ncbi:response regulator transcription factor [Caballeronia sp. GAFFF2]|uniref:LuxR family transcriptional regulator n=1 Tax=Caballeronia sp. GAFFF2 TaxID=2921741 RepID=UPI002027D337|nr:response regulator transcription factor [Caballeronia sp. GAFFF2]
MKITIMGADGERRAGLKTLLRRIARHAQFNEVIDWRQAGVALRQARSSLIVVDWEPHLRAGDLQTLLEEARGIPTAVVVDRPTVAQVYMLMGIGAMGVIPRTLDPVLIVRALDMVLIGGHCVPPDVIDPALSQESLIIRTPLSAAIRRRLRHLPALSPRQQQIMRCVHMGSTNKMIAKTLGISEGTVKIHLASIFQQLGATNRAAAVAIYNGVQTAHLEILRSSECEAPERAVPGQANVVPLRRRRALYPSLTESDASSLPMAAQPEATF